METDNQVRVLVVEDDRQIAEFLRRGLSEAKFMVDVAGNGLDGLELGIREAHDVIVLDIMLPSLNGFEVLQELRNRKINTPVLILSALQDVNDRVLGLQSGGDDFLTKPFAFAELVARIQSILRRAQGDREPARLQASDLVMDLIARKVFRGEEEIELQPQEFRLLEYFMRNKGRVQTRTQILRHVWGYYFNPSTNIVDVHVCRLREKIERADKPRLLNTVRGAGYSLVENDAM
ncbi:MAG: response regulator transcription factor [Syntrophobacter sp.]